MALEVFRSDRQEDSESAYRKWLCDNPNGFVVNALKTACGKDTESDKRFTRIHRASCKTINPLLSKADKAGFTTGDYQKLCAISLEIAVKEAKIATGIHDVKNCRCV